MTATPALLDLPGPQANALAWLLDRVPPGQFPWVLIGSAGLRLQGVDVPVHDIDLQTDLATIYLVEQRLAGFIKTPVHAWESPGMRSLDGKAEVEGIQVEFLANIAHRLPDGSWSAATDFSRKLQISWRGLTLAVFPLEDEAEAYEAMGRLEKAALIRQAIQSLHRP